MLKLILVVLCFSSGSLSLFAAPVARYSTNSNPSAPDRATVVVCEIHDDKILVTKLEGGVGGSTEKAFHLVGADKLRELYDHVLRYEPEAFRSRRATSEKTLLEIYPNVNGEGVAIYSVKDRLVTSHQFIVPTEPGGSSVGPYFSRVFDKIRSLCRTFAGVDIGETDWPGGGA